MPDMEPDLEVVRHAVETALAGLGPGIPLDLLGTSIEGRVLQVVVQSRRDGSVHVIRNDVADIRKGTGVRTLDRLVDELLFRSIHHQDLQLVSRSTRQVHEWH